MKRSSIVSWGLVRLAGWLAVAVGISALFIATCIIGSSRWFDVLNGQPLNLTDDDFASTKLHVIWIGGDAFLLFCFSLCEELLRRRKFDIETVRNDDPPKEPFFRWVMKIFLLYSTLAIALPGGSLLFMPLLHVTLEDYVAGYQMTWKASMLLWTLLFFGRVISGVLGLWSRELD